MPQRKQTRYHDAATGELLLWLRLHHSLVGYAALFLAGVCIGSAVALQLGALPGVEQMLGHYLLKRQSQPMDQTFFSALMPGAAVWGVLFLCGFCAVSGPIIAAVPCVRGMGYGVLAGALLLSRPQDGLRALCLLLLPNLMVSTVAMLLCCREARALSRYFWQAVVPQPRATVQASPSTFCGKMILYALLLPAGALLEAYGYLWWFG